MRHGHTLPTTAAAPGRGPDPRVVRSRTAALSAVRQLLAEEGWAGVTHVAVAARSGVGRTTLYRHWPDAASLIHDAVVERIGRAQSAPTGDLGTDLINEVSGLRQLLHDPVTELSMRAVLERAPFDPAFAALKDALYQSGTAGIRATLAAAIEAGELQPETDIQLAVEQLAGPLMYRRLFAGLDIDEDYPAVIVDGFVLRYGRKTSRRKSSENPPATK